MAVLLVSGSNEWLLSAIQEKPAKAGGDPEANNAQITRTQTDVETDCRPKPPGNTPWRTKNRAARGLLAINEKLKQTLATPVPSKRTSNERQILSNGMTAGICAMASPWMFNLPF